MTASLLVKRLCTSTIQRVTKAPMLLIVMTELAMKVLALGNAALGTLHTHLFRQHGGRHISYWQAPHCSLGQAAQMQDNSFRWSPATTCHDLDASSIESGGSRPLWSAAALARLSTTLLTVPALRLRNLMPTIISAVGALDRIPSIQALPMVSVSTLVILYHSALSEPASLIGPSQSYQPPLPSTVPSSPKPGSICFPGRAQTAMKTDQDRHSLWC